MKDTTDITSREYKMARRKSTLSCSFCSHIETRMRLTENEARRSRANTET